MGFAYLIMLCYTHIHEYVHAWRASLVTQTVKNLPAVREPGVRFLGQEAPLQKGMATHSNILAWRIPWTAEPGWGSGGGGYSPWGHKESTYIRKEKSLKMN